MMRALFKRGKTRRRRTGSGVKRLARVAAPAVGLGCCALLLQHSDPGMLAETSMRLIPHVGPLVSDDMRRQAIMLIFACLFLIPIGAAIWASRQSRRNIRRVRRLASSAIELSPREFLEVRMGALSGGGKGPLEFKGVYVIHNLTKDKYYVGQSLRVMQRVNQHLTGHGNGDVYADLKYGDDFTIHTLALAKSGYHNLNDLERDLIEAYDASVSGYNRTRGNRT